MLTTFQRNYIQQLTQRTDVKHLCLDYLNDDYKLERVIPVLFITTDGKLHGHKLGRKRLLGTITAE